MPPTDLEVREETSTSVSKVRRDIVRDYCRSMVVIDDRIFCPEKPQQIEDRFFALYQQCCSEGILCHLQHYTGNSIEADIEKINQAVTAAQKADVVVLDWKMGNSECADGPPEPGDSSHASKILEMLMQEEALRFVFIYTREPAKSVEDELRNTMEVLPSSLMVPSADLDDFSEGKKQEVEPVFHINHKIFVTVKQYTGNSYVGAQQLIVKIEDVLLRVFPDHLQWAGLELTERVRKILPKVVAALPSGTNDALLYQMLYQAQDEVAMQVSDALLDELRFSLQQEPLVAVGDELLLSLLQPEIDKTRNDQRKMTSIVQSRWNKYQKTLDAPKAEPPTLEQEKAEKISQHLLKQIYGEIDLARLRRVATGEEKFSRTCICTREGDSFCEQDVADFVSKSILKDQDTKQTLLSHLAWGTVRESNLLRATTDMPQLGSVYKKISEKGDVPKWLLCISPSCDCYRPTGKGYIFVAGQTSNIESSSPSQTQACVNKEQIVWLSDHLVARDNPLAEDAGTADYELFGSLRYEFIMRIVQRVWSYQSRVGVDTSQFLRKRRKE